MMKIEKFVLGALQTNSYLILNEDTKEVLIVDPATCPDYVVSHVKSNGYVPKGILLTHGHFDHVMGIEKWVELYDIPVYLHEEEKEVLEGDILRLNDPEYIAKYVREKYFYSKDGEFILRLD